MLAPTGTPSASRVSSANPASTGIVARPSRCGGSRRAASAPDRLTRPLPRSMPSPASTIRLSTTSTSDSAQAVARLNETENSVKISVVKVW